MDGKPLLKVQGLRVEIPTRRGVNTLSARVLRTVFSVDSRLKLRAVQWCTPMLIRVVHL